MKQGFTLIEILVVISIVMIMLGSGIAGYIQFNETQTLRGVAKEVQTYLRLAQKKARAGDRPTNCNRLDAYRFVAVAGQPQIVISAVCRGVEIESEVYYLSSGVVFDSAEQLDFAVLQGGVTGSGTITIRKDQRKFSFEVGAGGEVTAGDFDVQ